MDIRALVKSATASETADERLAAFGQIVVEFQDMAYGLAYGALRDSHAAEDVAQEAFIEAWRSLPALREPKAFPGWFRRIVLKYCDRLTRRRGPTVAMLSDAADVAAAEPNPHEEAEAQEVRSGVADALAALPKHEREVAMLHHIAGYTHVEVGDFLEIPLGTVKSRLRAARGRLHGRMLHMAREDIAGSRPSRADAFLRNVLFHAVRDVDVVKVEQIAEEHPRLAVESDGDGKTALTTLTQDPKFGEWRSEAWDKRRRVYQALVSAGAGPGLGTAIEGDDLGSVRRYIEANRDLLYRPVRAAQSRLQWSQPQTPLTVAANRGRTEIMEYLLGVGGYSQDQKDAALADAAFQTQTEAMDSLLRHGADITSAREVLIAGATNLSIAGAETLLPLGADPNGEDDYGRTPLAAAICSNCRSFPYEGADDDPDRTSGRLNQIAFIQTLSQAGVDIAETPVMAIVRGRPDVLADLLDGVADVNAPVPFEWIVDSPNAPVDGGSLLHFAAEFDEVDCAKLLIERGADVNATISRDGDGIGGTTPVFNAVAHNCHRPMLAYLIECGADLSVSATFDGGRLRAAFGQDAGFERRDLTPLSYCELTRDKAWHSWAPGEKAGQIALLREHGPTE